MKFTFSSSVLFRKMICANWLPRGLSTTTVHNWNKPTNNFFLWSLRFETFRCSRGRRSRYILRGVGSKRQQQLLLKSYKSKKISSCGKKSRIDIFHLQFLQTSLTTNNAIHSFLYPYQYQVRPLGKQGEGEAAVETSPSMRFSLFCIFCNFYRLDSPPFVYS